MRLLAWTFFLLLSLSATARQGAPVRHHSDTLGTLASNDDGKIAGDSALFRQPDIMAEFNGGLPGLAQYLKKHVVYPKSARKAKAQGKVFVAFVVDGTGAVKDVMVVKGVHPDLDRVAVEVVERMPKWTPGTLDGKPVDCRFVLPLNYRL